MYNQAGSEAEKPAEWWGWQAGRMQGYQIWQIWSGLSRPYAFLPGPLLPFITKNEGHLVPSYCLSGQCTMYSQVNKIPQISSELLKLHRPLEPLKELHVFCSLGIR